MVDKLDVGATTVTRRIATAMLVVARYPIAIEYVRPADLKAMSWEYVVGGY